MSKRFTATEKWNDGWYLNLPKEHKLIWIYLLDTCTNGGRWIKNFKMLNFCCDSKIDEDGFKKIFNGRTIDCGDFFFIPKFLKFQYPKGLNSEKPAILAVRAEVLFYGLLEYIRQLLGNDYLIIKDKDKETETDKEKDKKVITDGIADEKKKREAEAGPPDPETRKKIKELIGKVIPKAEVGV